MSEASSTTTAPRLSPDQQRSLLTLVRATICQTARREALHLQPPQEAWLNAPTAVFVTLWQETADCAPALRGCIGRVQPDLSLYQGAIKAAAGAASRDPRFPPLSAEELNGLTVEITLLSPQTLVSDLDELVLGRDGVTIEAWGRRALLLPSVAPRLGWNKTELLHNLCRKAGLPPDTWPAAGTLHRFEVFSFSAPLQDPASS